MKVTEAPEALGFVPEVMAMETAGTTEAFTPMVMLLLVAVVVVAQARLEVITQETICPLVSAVVVYVALLVPAFAPFTCH